MERVNMSRYAVGYIDFSDNELKIEIVEAIDWRDALIKAKIVPKYEGEKLDMIDKTLEEVKEDMWNSDCMIEVIKIDE